MDENICHVWMSDEISLVVEYGNTIGTGVLTGVQRLRYGSPTAIMTE